MSEPIETTANELATMADNIAQYRSRVSSVAERHLGSERDDLVAAIYEAERQLRVAERALTRAVRTAR